MLAGVSTAFAVALIALFSVLGHAEKVVRMQFEDQPGVRVAHATTKLSLRHAVRIDFSVSGHPELRLAQWRAFPWDDVVVSK